MKRTICRLINNGAVVVSVSVVMAVFSTFWTIREFIGWFSFGFVVDLAIYAGLFFVALMILAALLWFELLDYLDREFVRRDQRDDSNSQNHPPAIMR